MFNAENDVYLLSFLLVVLLALIITFIDHILRSPFKYPHFEWNFDVTGKRNVKIENEIDKMNVVGAPKAGKRKTCTHEIAKNENGGCAESW